MLDAGNPDSSSVCEKFCTQGRFTLQKFAVFRKTLPDRRSTKLPGLSNLSPNLDDPRNSRNRKVKLNSDRNKASKKTKIHFIRKFFVL